MILDEWFQQEMILVMREHLSMFGDILGYCNWGWEEEDLIKRGSSPYNVKYSLPNRII